MMQSLHSYEKQSKLVFNEFCQQQNEKSSITYPIQISLMFENLHNIFQSNAAPDL